MNNETTQSLLVSKRFRGFLPIVVDVETGGLNPNTDALLEVAMSKLNMNNEGIFTRGETYHWHIAPFEGGNLDPKALEINKIVPDHPFRLAVDEKDALTELFDLIQEDLKKHQCQ